jgi:flagellar hook assembly protein FlgD
LVDLVTYEIPKETELLPNYPNPFNPETWIPYRLAEDSSVTLTIYDTSGKVVRTIEIGHKPAAVYESRDKAVHWDGRNNYGERVASGIYFYSLSAVNFSATRKMVILK